MKRLSPQADAVKRAAAILREHFRHAVIIVPTDSKRSPTHYKMIGNRSCCRGLLSDTYEFEFSVEESEE